MIRFRGVSFQTANQPAKLEITPRPPAADVFAGIQQVATAALCLRAHLRCCLIVLELNKGTLSIECDVDDIPVRIMQGDKVVERLTVSKTGASVRVTAGNYVVEIDGQIDGFTVENGTVELQRRGEWVVRIVRDDGSASTEATAALGNGVRDAGVELQQLVGLWSLVETRKGGAAKVDGWLNGLRPEGLDYLTFTEGSWMQCESKRR